MHQGYLKVFMFGGGICRRKINIDWQGGSGVGAGLWAILFTNNFIFTYWGSECIFIQPLSETLHFNMLQQHCIAVATAWVFVYSIHIAMLYLYYDLNAIFEEPFKCCFLCQD